MSFFVQGLADSKSGVGDEEVRNTAVNLVMVSHMVSVLKAS